MMSMPRHLFTWLPVLLLSSWAWSPVLAAQVLSVGDGDTITVVDGGKRVTVRLACIDAPETAQTPYGMQSRSALQQLVPVGSQVTVQGSKRDRYGRTIAEILRGNTNVNLELVHQGQAFVYRQYLSGCDRNAYLSAEKRAEGARLGVWSVTGGITRPWDWRHGGAGKRSQSPGGAATSGRYRCREIGSWNKAQELLKQGHTHLDRDGDGEACESLH